MSNSATTRFLLCKEMIYCVNGHVAVRLDFELLRASESKAA